MVNKGGENLHFLKGILKILYVAVFLRACPCCITSLPGVKESQSKTTLDIRDTNKILCPAFLDCHLGLPFVRLPTLHKLLLQLIDIFLCGKGSSQKRRIASVKYLWYLNSLYRKIM